MSAHHIFIVDGEPIIRQLLGHHITSSWGHTARTFADAESCLEAIDGTPDLIIMDIGMPGMGGVEALRRVREADPNLPVIMLSAQESVDVAVSTWKLGAHDYLTKPPDLAHHFADTDAIVPLETLREEAIRHALKVTSGNIVHAARQLAVGRATFYRLMKRYGIPVDR